MRMDKSHCWRSYRNDINGNDASGAKMEKRHYSSLASSRQDGPHRCETRSRSIYVLNSLMDGHFRIPFMGIGTVYAWSRETYL